MTISYQNPIPSPVSDEIFDVFGVQLQFLIAPEETGNQTSIYKGILPSGVVIPLHRHPDSEVFYVLEGTLEVYQESGEHKGWHSLLAGGALAVAPGVKHALRNTSSAPSAAIAVTEPGLYKFLSRNCKTCSAGAFDASIARGHAATPRCGGEVFLLDGIARRERGCWDQARLSDAEPQKRA
jgi:quercetin dioxygenase-like cupin family protein